MWRTEIHDPSPGPRTQCRQIFMDVPKPGLPHEIAIGRHIVEFKRPLKLHCFLIGYWSWKWLLRLDFSIKTQELWSKVPRCTWANFSGTRRSEGQMWNKLKHTRCFASVVTFATRAFLLVRVRGGQQSHGAVVTLTKRERLCNDSIFPWCTFHRIDTRWAWKDSSVPKVVEECLKGWDDKGLDHSYLRGHRGSCPWWASPSQRGGISFLLPTLLDENL